MGKGEWAYVKPEVEGRSYVFHVAVTRKYDITIFRLVAPMSMLVIMSWSGFFINPAKLMPRFASGFISFLSLNAFKGYAIKLMPKDGKINSMSWIDVYISIAGYLMVLAVLETVVTQFVFENVTRNLAYRLDTYARYGFPSSFLIVL